MIATEITQLAAVFAAATMLGLVVKRWRLPLIIAYILTGLILSQTGWLSASLQPLWQIFSDIGIALLLFLVGMEIDYASLRRVGPAALVIGLGQVVFTFGAGFILTLLLGIAPLTAGYIAIALTFSSTVIVVKLLSEKNDMNSLYGKIALGILLVQDVVAIGMLVVIGAPGGDNSVYGNVLAALLKGVILFAVIFWLGRKAMPKLFDYFSHSRELLWLASLAWLFVMAALADWLGLSLAAGGFMAGLALANSAEHFQIAGRIRPLRDFFIAIFFIFLGTTVSLTGLADIAWPMIVLSIFVLIGNPFIVMMIMQGMGYHHRTGFMTGVSIAQISEFSFILAALGAASGHLDAAAVTLITGVGLITIIVSSSIIVHAQSVYQQLHPLLHRWLGGTGTAMVKRSKTTVRPILVIGAHRTGSSIINDLDPAETLVIDFDPDVVVELQRQKRAVLFGDGGDSEILDQVTWSKTRLVISTSPDLNDQLRLLEYLPAKPEWSGKVIVRAETVLDAQELYARGADYVLLPSLTAGQYLGQAINRDPSLKHLGALRQRDQKLMSTNS